MSETALRITEIFHSLQGETSTVGLPTVFVRLTGCPLRCGYCDTAYAFEGGSKWTLSDILSTVADYGAKYVTVTGGEPLAQPQCIELLEKLCDLGYRVSLETSGAMPVDEVDPRVFKIVENRNTIINPINERYIIISNVSSSNDISRPETAIAEKDTIVPVIQITACNVLEKDLNT